MHLKTNGTSLWIEESGAAGAPIVLLSHSLGSSAVMWRPQLPALEPDWRVLRVDTRGHGRSAAPDGPYSFEQLAADLVGALDLLGIEAVHFVGLSMGGMIGQALGIFHPGRLLSLTLCDTAASNPPGAREIWEARIAQVEREGSAPLLESTLERWLSPEFRRRRPPILEEIRRQFLETSPQGYAGCCRAIMALDYRERLSAIGVPTLVVVGEDDPGTPVAAARELATGIAGARLEIIPAARHLSNVEQPEIFNRILTAFLAGR
jgi:3-oxoadipate enol-lactonase